MAATALVLSVAAFIACLGILQWSLRRFEGIETAPPSSYDDSEVRAALTSHRAHIEELTDAIADLEETSRDQTLAIAEGIERVDRAERRVRAAVGRARKRMEDLGYVDEGLEAEAAQLREIDGDDGQEQRLLALRGGVEETPNGHPGGDMTAFPGRW